MDKKPVESQSLRAFVSHLESMIGRGKRFPSINAMAVALKMHPTTLRRYLKMESDLTLSMLDSIAHGLGASADELIDPRKADIALADRLAVECLDLLRGLSLQDLERVAPMLQAFAGPPSVVLKKRQANQSLDALTEPHSVTEAGHAAEGSSNRAVGGHPKKRATRDS